jgi:hypothetical protein
MFTSASLGGCTLANRANTDATADPTPTEPPKIRLENFPDLSSEEVTFKGRIIQRPTEEEPLRIELWFVNEGPEREFYFGAFPPFTNLTSVESQLVLIPDTREDLGSIDPDAPDVFVPEKPEQGCWQALNRPIWLSYSLGIDLASGESIGERYTVLADATADQCFASGTYRFEKTFRISGPNHEHPLHFEVVIP